VPDDDARDEELGRLTAALAAATAGHGGTVLLAGEAGIGKSRLARAAARLAAEQGLAVPTGRAVAGGVPGAGHMVNMEQPAMFNQLLTTFLNEQRPALPEPGVRPVRLARSSRTPSR
jgi:pimeloyl-ACP methyl ester carboxylesterase